MNKFEKQLADAQVSLSKGERAVYVYFCHDMSDSWYDAFGPNDTKINGSYNTHKPIEKEAEKHGLTIKWLGDNQYNPWRKR